jgi:hypothetical protein
MQCLRFQKIRGGREHVGIIRVDAAKSAKFLQVREQLGVRDTAIEKGDSVALGNQGID